MQDTTISFQNPIAPAQGHTPISQLAVQKGSLALIDVAACNIMKSLWGDDAGEWKPERWLAPLPETVLDAHIPGIYSNTHVPTADLSDYCSQNSTGCRLGAAPGPA